MVDDLLPGEHLRGLISFLRCLPSELQSTLALLELSSWLDGNRLSVGQELNVSDRETTNQVLADLQEMGSILQRRMSRPPCLYSDRDSLTADDFTSPWELGTSRHSWKPTGALWTSPLVGKGHSAWSLRALLYGDALPHPYNLVLSRPSPETVYVVRDLAQADSLLRGDHGGALPALRALHQRGYVVINFTWRSVLEAEIAVLRGERDPSGFPSGLGVECSLWLEAPRGLEQVVSVQAEAARMGPPGWFTYE